MPITISKEIERKLPAVEKAGIEEFLWSKSGAKCSLCDGPLNRASDKIEPDHVIPEREAGKTERANLLLAHKECNAWKRNSPSVDVRAFLRFRRFLGGLGGQMAHYGDCLPHFEITPMPTHVDVGASEVRLAFGDGSIAVAPIFAETNRERTYLFAFISVPRVAVYNDEDCQPRTIKVEHLWKLYSDIQRNPLHEPPSLRVGPADSEGLSHLLMFDGQHKSLAMWLSERPSLVAKLYLDLPTEDTVRLVNSIQARIPKLPLSTFELSAKMDDENQARLMAYLADKGASATEAGFIDSAEVAVRDRVKAAFKLALVNSLIENPDLVFVKNVARAGDKAKNKITENVFKTRVADVLLQFKPLDEPWSQSEVMRAREQENIVKALNYLHELAFVEPPGGFSAQESERRRRLSYQGGLTLVCGLIKGTFRHILVTDVGREFLDKEPDSSQWARIEAAIKLLIEHPVWTADLELSARMRTVSVALTKFQDIESAFRAVGLTTGYVVGADTLPSNWAGS